MSSSNVKPSVKSSDHKNHASHAAKPAAKSEAKAHAPVKSAKAQVSQSSESMFLQREEALRHLSGDKKKYYDLLVRIRNEITNQIEILADDALKSQKDSGGDLSAMSTHMADRGSDYFLRSMELDMITNESEVIDMIEEAIQRLLGDDFGICLDCGHKINKARLEALPYARYCIDCTSIREKNGGLRPDYQD